MKWNGWFWLGFMRILGTEFVHRFPDKVLNIHPSLLPKYPGINAIQKAFDNAESETGVTVHFVNEGVDSGNIILQEKVVITPQDTLESLETKVHQVEHQIYPKAIQKVLWGMGFRGSSSLRGKILLYENWIFRRSDFGQGLGGLIAANLLQRKGLKVVILDHEKNLNLIHLFVSF
jgi:hypothetical protein